MQCSIHSGTSSNHTSRKSTCALVKVITTDSPAVGTVEQTTGRQLAWQPTRNQFGWSSYSQASNCLVSFTHKHTIWNQHGDGHADG